MRLLLVLPVFLVTCLGSDAQTVTSQGIDFINSVIHDKRDPTYLIESIPRRTLKSIYYRLGNGIFSNRIRTEDGRNISDSLQLTHGEMHDLNRQIKALRHFIWTQATAKWINLNQLTLITPDSASALSMNDDIKYCIVPPLFFHHGEYCLFYYDYACGGLCGHGELMIYQRSGTKWVRRYMLMGWNS